VRDSPTSTTAAPASSPADGSSPSAAHAAAMPTTGTSSAKGCNTYASLRIAEQRLSLQEIAEELGHSLEVLATHYAHVISEYARKGRIDPEKLIREARKRVAGGDVSRRTRRQMDAISPAAPSE
jgi:hypothetical protein